MRVSVIGAGGWGTALAITAHKAGSNVTLWSREESTVEEINTRHTNSTFLPNISIPESIKATRNPEELSDSDIVVVAVPTQYIRSAFEENNFKISDSTLVTNAAKGIEKNTMLRVSEILADVIKLKRTHYVNLTGPSHAEEVAQEVPTTVVAASLLESNAEKVQTAFSTPNFRVYSSQDVIGTEIGGALKNVIAIAAGIIDGIQLGDNTKAALLTRGLAEIARLGAAMGANPLTFGGLSGLGDLFVTCASKHSRNRYVGEQIGKGKTLQEILQSMSMVAEGVSTTVSAFQLSKNLGVEMPIAHKVHEILFDNKPAKIALHELMTRESKSEHWT